MPSTNTKNKNVITGNAATLFKKDTDFIAEEIKGEFDFNTKRKEEAKKKLAVRSKSMLDNHVPPPVTFSRRSSY